jgi:hypothetical protein
MKNLGPKQNPSSITIFNQGYGKERGVCDIHVVGFLEFSPTWENLSNLIEQREFLHIYCSTCQNN